MATSGTTTFAMTSRDTIAAAMRKLGVLDPDEAPTASEAADGLQALELMLKSWSAAEHLWIRSIGTLALVASQVAYPLAGVRRLESARRKTGGIETPLMIYARSDYDDVPNKATTGMPIAVYFDPQRSVRTLYVWYAASAAVAANTTITYTYRRVIEDVASLNNTLDLPQEWLETLVYNLAVRIAPDFGVGTTNPDFRDVQAMAAALLTSLKAQDQEDESVFFGVASR